MSSKAIPLPKYHKRKLWKYKLDEDYAAQTDIKPDHNINTGFLFLSGGILVISKDYAWDGASGPCFDTHNVMRGSLIHDALYQLMDLGLLDWSYRELADRELQKACLEDGMNRIRAWYIYIAVRIFGRVWRERNRVFL